MLYVLVGLSLFRLIPYRWWRWTHKLLGIPFAFASWHFYTATKTYENGSPWGIWFGLWMLVGLGAFGLRVLGRDTLARGLPYRVTDAKHKGSITHITLEPIGPPINQEIGQFAFLKLDLAGMREPHPFTIASNPETNKVEFFIRHLGDWSDRLPESELIGSVARIEGPYGRFEPFGSDGHRNVWVAGGVGITPFLAALQTSKNDSLAPTLLYAVGSDEDNPIVDRLREAESQGRVDLHLFVSGQRRLTPEALSDIFDAQLEQAHVALCGPAGLVSTMAAAAQQMGALSIETEDFDIRQGFGPDRSRELSPTKLKQLSTTSER